MLQKKPTTTDLVKRNSIISVPSKQETSLKRISTKEIAISPSKQEISGDVKRMSSREKPTTTDLVKRNSIVSVPSKQEISSDLRRMSIKEIAPIKQEIIVKRMSVKEVVTLPSTSTATIEPKRESKRVSKVALQPIAEPVIMKNIPKTSATTEAISKIKPKEELYGSTENVVEIEDTITEQTHQDADPQHHQYASADIALQLYSSNDPEIQQAVLELENINPPT